MEYRLAKSALDAFNDKDRRDQMSEAQVGMLETMLTVSKEIETRG